MGRQASIVNVLKTGDRGPRKTGSTKAERVELLSRVPLFSSLSKRNLRKIAEAATDARYRPFATIVREGEPGDTFFAIVDGTAKVVRGTRKAATLQSGDFFGEISLIDGGPRTASVIAESTMLTMRLSRATFSRMLKADPKIGVAILQEVARRLREREKPLTA